jgi:hypothetical protein
MQVTSSCKVGPSIDRQTFNGGKPTQQNSTIFIRHDVLVPVLASMTLMGHVWNSLGYQKVCGISSTCFLFLSLLLACCF